MSRAARTNLAYDAAFSARPRYLTDTERLTPEQAATIGREIGPTRGYLARLIERMDRTNLRYADAKLYALVRAAEDAVHSLCVELHYQSCERGVGREAGGA